MNIITPEVTHGIVSRLDGTLFSYQAWPTIARDENGTLYAVCSSMRNAHLCPFGKTAMFISKTNGKTWTRPMIINDSYLDDRDAGILYMGNGRLLVSWFNHSAKSYQTEYAASIESHVDPRARKIAAATLEGYDLLPEDQIDEGSYVMISEDYGVTWSERIFVPVTAPHGPNICADGTLVYVGSETYGRNPDTRDRISAYSSTDGGYTWNYLSSLPIAEGTRPGNYSEPHVIELSPGRLLAVIRAEGPEIKGGNFEIPDGTLRPGYTFYTSVSEDGGKTWSTMAPTGISGAPAHLFRHSSGAIICSYGRREKPFSERAAVSYDNGKTWEEEYEIDHRGTDYDMGYPSTTELSDGSLITIYYQKYKNDPKCSILYSIWKLK